MRLIYSPDDGGWYWEDRNWRTSQIFATEAEAQAARAAGKLVWN